MNVSEASSKHSDQQLWERVLSEDREAFECVYHKHAPNILAFVRSRVRGRVDAEAISQQVWLNVWKNRATCDGENVKAWLFRIVRNLISDHLTARDTRLVQNVIENQMPANSYEIMTEDPRLEALRECLKEHGNEFIQVLRMNLQGMSSDEIAETMGISIKTVYTRSSRGRAEVRECIEKKTQ